MKCPVDGNPLVIAERSGVEIDYCPQCRGVWLDRGELDKIIERAAVAPSPAPRDERQHQARGYDDSRHKDHKYKKKETVGGFLEDLFDF